MNVTLPPSLDRLLLAMAKHQRVSKSQVLRELLIAAEPALQRVVALMDSATKATKEVHQGLAQSLNKAQDTIEADLERAMAQIESVGSDLVSQAEAVRFRRPGRVVAGAQGGGKGSVDPPSSNRGVKSQKRAVKGGQS